jgi:hypothetical protein
VTPPKETEWARRTRRDRERAAEAAEAALREAERQRGWMFGAMKEAQGEVIVQRFARADAETALRETRQALQELVEAVPTFEEDTPDDGYAEWQAFLSVVARARAVLAGVETQQQGEEAAIPFFPEWPQVRCVNCAHVWTQPPSGTAGGNTPCPECGEPKWNTTFATTGLGTSVSGRSGEAQPPVWAAPLSPTAPRGGGVRPDLPAGAGLAAEDRQRPGAGDTRP